MTGNVMQIVGNIIFVILSSKLKNDRDEYLAFLNFSRNHKLTNWKNSTGFNCMEWQEIFKGNKMSEDGFLHNCPNILVEKPWRKQ